MAAARALAARLPSVSALFARPPFGFSSGVSRGFKMQNLSMWQRLNSLQPDHVVYAIIGLNIAIFGLWQTAPCRGFMYTHFTTSFTHLKMGYLHTLLTSSVSQQTVGHLFSNMFTFYFFGTSLLSVIGTVRVRSAMLASCWAMLVVAVPEVDRPRVTVAPLGKRQCNTYGATLPVRQCVPAHTIREQQTQHSSWERCVQFIQLYAGSAVVSGLAQSLFDRRVTSYGASGAVNAILMMSVLLNPFATYLVMGVIPAPAWLVGAGFFAYDIYGAKEVRCHGIVPLLRNGVAAC